MCSLPIADGIAWRVGMGCSDGVVERVMMQERSLCKRLWLARAETAEAPHVYYLQPCTRPQLCAASGCKLANLVP